MPRDGSGHYFYPAGTPGIPDTTIESAKYNTYIDDVRQDLNTPRPIVTGGTGASTALDALQNLGGVPQAGGFMTGPLTLTPAAGPAILQLTKSASGYGNIIAGYTAANSRWLMYLGSPDPETGANAGSDFQIHRYNDAGTHIGMALEINRASGLVTSFGPMTVYGNTVINGNATVNGDVYANRSANQGVVFLGSDGIHYLHWTGTSYSLPSGPLSVGGALTCAAITGQAINVHGITCHAINTQGNIVIANGGMYIQNDGNPTIGFQDTNGTNRTGLFYNRGNNSFDMLGPATTSLSIPGSGKVQVSNGIQSKDGYSGGYGTVCYNLNWNGSSFYLKADDFGVGFIAIQSDYRTKKDVINLPGTWDVVKALRPISYTQADFGPAPVGGSGGPLYVADDIVRWGFLAHEIQDATVPSAATGHKDIEGEVQQPNPWTVIAALTKALQEAMARIEALESA